MGRAAHSKIDVRQVIIPIQIKAKEIKYRKILCFKQCSDDLNSFEIISTDLLKYSTK